MDNFKENILNHDWSFINGNTDCNIIWDNIEKAIVTHADTYFPIEQIVKKESQDGWLTKDIKVLIDEKNELIWKASKSNDDDIIKKAHKKRNCVNKIVKKAKRDYYKEKIDINMTNSKKLWKFLNEIVPCSKKNKKDSNIQLTDDDNNIIEYEVLPDYVNNFFNKVGNTNDVCNDITIHTVYGPFPKPIFNFSPVSEIMY